MLRCKLCNFKCEGKGTLLSHIKRMHEDRFDHLERNFDTEDSQLDDLIFANSQIMPDSSISGGGGDFGGGGASSDF